MYVKLYAKFTVALIMFAFHLLFLYIERFTNASRKLRLVYITISFVLYCLPLYLFKVNFMAMAVIVTWVCILYVFLYQNVMLSLLVWIVLATRLLLFLKVPPIASPYNYKVYGNLSGLTTNTAVFTVMTFLLRRLTGQRNKYQTLSIRDSLTNVYSLSYVVAQSKEKLEKDHDITILLIDINNFKQINDTYGHIIGNHVLVQSANFLKKSLANYNAVIGRVGGDEFIILLLDYSLTEVEKIAEELYVSINHNYFELDPDIDSIQLTFAIGFSSLPASEKSYNIDGLIMNANIDRYVNKYGKNRQANNYSYFSQLFSEDIIHFLDVLAEKDMYTFIHSEYAAQYAAALARRINLPDDRVREIFKAGWLHDMGKIYMSNNILRKIGKLSDTEYTTIKEHVKYGLNIIKSFNLSETICNGILYHHEQWDGNGYIHGLKGDEIPLEARIIKIADAFSAMIIKRVYRTPVTRQKALDEIALQSGIQFDAELVDAFISIFELNEKRYIKNTISDIIT